MCALICFKHFKNMNCNNCNNKASITFNNIDYCISCFMSSDSRQLAGQQIQKAIQKETKKKPKGRPKTTPAFLV